MSYLHDFFLRHYFHNVLDEWSILGVYFFLQRLFSTTWVFRISSKTIRPPSRRSWQRVLHTRQKRKVFCCVLRTNLFFTILVYFYHHPFFFHCYLAICKQNNTKDFSTGYKILVYQHRIDKKKLRAWFFFLLLIDHQYIGYD